MWHGKLLHIDPPERVHNLSCLRAVQPTRHQTQALTNRVSLLQEIKVLQKPTAGQVCADKCAGGEPGEHLGSVQPDGQRVHAAGPDRAGKRRGAPQRLRPRGAQPQEQSRLTPQRAGRPPYTQCCARILQDMTHPAWCNVKIHLNRSPLPARPLETLLYILKHFM